MANAQVEVQYLDNGRGGFYLIHMGYRFFIKSRRNERCYWKCVDRQCPAAITTVENLPVSIRNNHSHDADFTGITARAFVADLKRKCQDEVCPIPTMYDEELGKLRDKECDDHVVNVIQRIPTFQSVKTALYRHRAKLIPKLPKTADTIDLPDEWTETLAGDKFLQCDDTDVNGNRILLFATDENLRRLCDATVVMGDGTFYSCPRVFYQIYTIHAAVDGQMYPLVFAFLPNKTEQTYLRFLSLLKDVVRERIQTVFTPEIVMLDFEMAMRNALKAALPLCTLRLCFFHYTQCIWRKTQAVGLALRYREDDAIQKLVRRAAVLPLVPVNLVEDVWFAALEDIDDTSDAVRRFTDYVTETWVESERREWNHFDNEGPRTTNSLEGWHSRLNKISKKAHPNIYAIIDILRKEQAACEAKTIQLAAGGKPRPKRRKYRHLDNRLQTLKERFLNGLLGVVDYADAASHLLHID